MPTRTLVVAAMLALLATSVLPPATARQPTPPGPEASFTNLEELGRYLEREAAAERFSGVVLLARDGTPVLLEAYGYADRSREIPNRVDTKLNIGSLNKLFTKVAVLQLVEKGKLGLGDAIGSYLPQLPEDVGSAVTVGHLLEHRSGWGAYWDNPDYLARRTELRTMDDYMSFIKDIPLDFDPGARMQYSNTGYEVLGAIVERVSGQPYYDYVREHVYRPAGMTDTDAYEIDSPVENRAIGYTGGGYERTNMDTVPVKGTAAGGGYSTAMDLLRFVVALRDGKLVDEGQAARLLGGGFAGGAPGISATLEPAVAGHTIVVLSNFDPPISERLGARIRRMLTGSGGGPQERGRGEFGASPTSHMARRLVELTHTTGDDALRLFITEWLSPASRERNGDERLMEHFGRMRDDVRDAELKRAARTGDSSAEIVLHSQRTGRTMTVTFELEPEPPHRIETLSAEVER